MISIISTIFLVYFVGIIYVWKAWVKLPYLSKLHDLEHKISVIVAVRNEASNVLRLLASLENQNYTNYEVIIIDDHSEDDTLILIRRFEFEKLTVLQAEGQGKKTAIEQAIGVAKGDILAFTDGDCTVGEDWLGAINAYFIESNKIIGCGPVSFKECDSTFKKLQQIEFVSLIGTGAAFLSLQKPTMCNGANLFYKKSLFSEVGGFEGNTHLASGDDEFILHKVEKLYPGKSGFLKDERAIVSTYPKENIQDFVAQRKRWSSKWKHYKNRMSTLLAPSVFVANMAVLFAFIYMFVELKYFLYLFSLIGMKYIVEFWFLQSVHRFLYDKKLSEPYFAIMFILYPFYTLYFGLQSGNKKYIWKDREVN